MHDTPKAALACMFESRFRSQPGHHYQAGVLRSSVAGHTSKVRRGGQAYVQHLHGATSLSCEVGRFENDSGEQVAGVGVQRFISLN